MSNISQFFAGLPHDFIAQEQRYNWDWPMDHSDEAEFARSQDRQRLALDESDMADAAYTLHNTIKQAYLAGDMQAIGQAITRVLDNAVQRRTEFDLYARFITPHVQQE